MVKTSSHSRFAITIRRQILAEISVVLKKLEGNGGQLHQEKKLCFIVIRDKRNMLINFYIIISKNWYSSRFVFSTSNSLQWLYYRKICKWLPIGSQKNHPNFFFLFFFTTTNLQYFHYNWCDTKNKINKNTKILNSHDNLGAKCYI